MSPNWKPGSFKLLAKTGSVLVFKYMDAVRITFFVAKLLLQAGFSLGYLVSKTDLTRILTPPKSDSIAGRREQSVQSIGKS